MGQVIFSCPVTGREFDTGFHAKPSDLKFIPKGATIWLRCRICGETHKFDFITARIEEKR